MKITRTFTSITLILSALFFSSCGSIGGALSKHKRPVFLMMAPQDLVVKVDGVQQDIESDIFATYAVGNTTIDYYTSSVRLPYKKNVSVEISSEGKTATFELKPKMFGAVFVGNLILFPIVGHIIDAVTKNGKTLKPRYIDVERALEGKAVTDWRGKKKLKRIQKRSIRKG
jgi:hypothetical protein